MAETRFGTFDELPDESEPAMRPVALRLRETVFFWGASLTDLEGLLEGAGSRMRHATIRSVEQAELPALGRLIGAAIEERCVAPGRP